MVNVTIYSSTMDPMGWNVGELAIRNVMPPLKVSDSSDDVQERRVILGSNESSNISISATLSSSSSFIIIIVVVIIIIIFFFHTSSMVSAYLVDNLCAGEFVSVLRTHGSSSVAAGASCISPLVLPPGGLGWAGVAARLNVIKAMP